MARYHLTGSLLCATALLSACGGGGSGNIASTPNPLAAPAATPAAIPTPAATTFVPSSVTPFGLTREHLKFDYDADTGTYLYTGVNGIVSSTYKFGPEDASTQIDNKEPYNFRVFGDENTPGLLVLINSSRNSRIVLSHLSYGLSTSSLDAFVWGTETPAGNMPRTGSATYQGIVDGGGGGRRLLGSTGSLSANFATGTVSTSLSLQGRGAAYDEGLGYGDPGDADGLAEPDLFGTLSGNGTIGAGTSHFSGNLTGSIDFPAGGPTGTPGGPSATGGFLGGFYGPNAAEAGYVFTVTTGKISSDPNIVTGMTITGVFVGKQ